MTQQQQTPDWVQELATEVAVRMEIMGAGPNTENSRSPLDRLHACGALRRREWFCLTDTDHVEAFRQKLRDLGY